MGDRAKDLADRLRRFNDEVIAFVEGCGEEDWRKTTAEEWSVGVVARHIGAGHYAIIDLARMIVDGAALPPLTAEQLVQMANDHARMHADCTQAEVLEILRKNGKSLAQFTAGLGDEELDRTGFLTMLNRDVSTQQFLEAVILQSGGEHLSNMRAAKAS